MKTVIWILALLLGVSPLLQGVETEQSPSVLLQEALYQEQTTGDLDKAIELYNKVLAQAADIEQLASRATYQLGQCYLKKGDQKKAIEYFQKVISDYSSRTEIAQQSVEQLEKLNVPVSRSSVPQLKISTKKIDPATLMPPNTKMYLEMGSPGDHIETILNMLKGTPLENPLTLLGSGNGNGEKNPGDIIGALLNPSMITEFKKIRGMAVGVIDIQNNNPPMILVLFPGESDALRGLLLAGLGMVGTPGEPLEGMQTLSIEDQAGIAYDDAVFIIANPMDQLTWAVKQYKGITAEPTLASQNQSFKKITKESRQENLATVWWDVDNIFSDIKKEFNGAELPAEFVFANQIADFDNLDDLIVQLILHEDHIAIDAELNLKDGHQCLPYNLIHTPYLTANGLSAIPENAVLSASIALGDADSAAAVQIQEKISHITGLDIGREIFNNIEQINVFVIEPKDITQVGKHPIEQLGLSITSKNPQKTKALLNQILSLVSLGMQASGNFDGKLQSDPQNGIYAIPTGEKTAAPCYLKQQGNTTLLSFSSSVIQDHFKNAPKHKNALTSGVLKSQLDNVSPDTSKFITCNVGGLMRVADTTIKILFNNPQNPAHPLIREFSQIFDNTFVRLQTTENKNQLHLHVSLDGIPGLAPLFPYVMRLSQIDMTAQGCAGSPNPADGGMISPDSAYKLSWKAGLSSINTHNVYFGTSATDLKLYKKVLNATEIEGPKQDKNVSTYYWRVDEVFEDTIIQGDIWSFQTGKLVGHWKLDETEGNTAKDVSGTGHDATLENTEQKQNSHVTGINGSAINLDGVDDCLLIPALNLNSNSSTITAWIKRNGNQTGDTGIIFSRDAGTVAGLCFYHDGTNLGYNWADDRQTWSWDSQLSVPNDEWVFVSLIIEPSKATMYLGQDDTLKSATNELWHRTVKFDGKTCIGCDPMKNTHRYFKGAIDDVQFYNYPLSQTEIQKLYDAGKTTSVP